MPGSYIGTPAALAPKYQPAVIPASRSACADPVAAATAVSDWIRESTP